MISTLKHEESAVLQNYKIKKITAESLGNHIKAMKCNYAKVLNKGDMMT